MEAHEATEAMLNPAYFPRTQKPPILWNDWDRAQEAAGLNDTPSFSYGGGWR